MMTFPFAKFAKKFSKSGDKLLHLYYQRIEITDALIPKTCIVFAAKLRYAYSRSV
jgi:hypothetical protein